MATTNQQAATPEVPSWLNLDELVPVKMRERIAALTAEGIALEDQVAEWCKRAWNVVTDYGDVLSKVQDWDLRDQLDPLTGFDALWNVAQAISDDGGAITDSAGEAHWLAEEKAKREAAGQ